MQSPTAEERFNAWGYPELTDGTNTAFLIGGAKPYVKSNELKRDGVMAVVEWEPSDRFHTTIDAYWSRFKDDQRLRGIGQIGGASGRERVGRYGWIPVVAV